MRSHSRSFASVFLERATGVFGLTLLAAGFALANPEILVNPVIRLAIIAAVSAARSLSSFSIAPPCYRARSGGSVDCRSWAPPAQGEQVVHDVTYFRHRQRTSALEPAYSFAFHLLAGMSVYVA